MTRLPPRWACRVRAAASKGLTAISETAFRSSGPASRHWMVRMAFRSRDEWPPCGDHGEQWHWRVDALAVHKVPSALSDHRRNPGGEVVISLARPGRDTQDRDARNNLLSWQPPGPVGCEHGDFETPERQEATCNLMDVHLSPTEFGEVTRADHKYAEWLRQRLVPAIAE